MDSITDKRIGTMGGQLPLQGKTPSRSRARKRQRGVEDEQPRGGVKPQKAGIGYPLPESIIELMSKEVQRESFIVSRT